jgi:drug/metabolite transporter (DMT)-like permease
MPAPPIPPNLARLVLLAVAAELTLMDALIKLLTARYPTLQIALLRYVFGLGGALVYTAWVRPGWPTREATLHNGLRAILIAVIATSFFYALGKLPLADAIALSFISPVLTALMGALLLGERLDWRILVALLAGLGGMLLIVGGSLGTGHYGDDVLLGAGAVLVSAVGYSLNIVMLRHRATRDSLSHIVLFQNLGPALILTVPGLIVWVAPTPADVALFALLGAIGVIAHHAGPRLCPPGGSAAGAGAIPDAGVGRLIRLPVFLGDPGPRHGPRGFAYRGGHPRIAAASIERVQDLTLDKKEPTALDRADQAPPATQPKLIQL